MCPTTYFRYLHDPIDIWVYDPRLRHSCFLSRGINLLLLLFRLYDLYSFQVIPVLGEVIAGDWKSYQYLVESIRQFPSQVQNFCSLPQRPQSWNPGNPCDIFVSGGLQGIDRRCRFWEGDLWKSNIRHCGHSFWLQTVTSVPSWSMSQSHSVESLELEG